MWLIFSEDQVYNEYIARHIFCACYRRFLQTYEGYFSTPNYYFFIIMKLAVLSKKITENKLKCNYFEGYFSTPNHYFFCEIIRFLRGCGIWEIEIHFLFIFLIYHTPKQGNMSNIFLPKFWRIFALLWNCLPVNEHSNHETCEKNMSGDIFVIDLSLGKYEPHLPRPRTPQKINNQKSLISYNLRNFDITR